MHVMHDRYEEDPFNCTLAQIQQVSEGSAALVSVMVCHLSDGCVPNAVALTDQHPAVAAARVPCLSDVNAAAKQLSAGIPCLTLQLVLGNPATTRDGKSWTTVTSMQFYDTDDLFCTNWVWGSYCGGQVAPGGATTGLSGWILVGHQAEVVQGPAVQLSTAGSYAG
jgi:hypothetical protein